MGHVIIRNLDDAVITALKARAAARGISLEEEIRRLLSESVRPTPEEARETAAAIRALGLRPVRVDLERLVREDRGR